MKSRNVVHAQLRKCNVSQGVWNPKLSMVKVVVSKGKRGNSQGCALKGISETMFFVEEALYLIAQGDFDLRLELTSDENNYCLSEPLSLQDAFALLSECLIIQSASLVPTRTKCSTLESRKPLNHASEISSRTNIHASSSTFTYSTAAIIAPIITTTAVATTAATTPATTTAAVVSTPINVLGAGNFYTPLLSFQCFSMLRKQGYIVRRCSVHFNDYKRWKNTGSNDKAKTLSTQNKLFGERKHARSFRKGDEHSASDACLNSKKVVRRNKRAKKEVSSSSSSAVSSSSFPSSFAVLSSSSSSSSAISLSSLSSSVSSAFLGSRGWFSSGLGVWGNLTTTCPKKESNTMKEIMDSLLREGRISTKLLDLRARSTGTSNEPDVRLRWRAKSPGWKSQLLVDSLQIDQFFVWQPGETFQRTWARRPDFVLLVVPACHWSPKIALLQHSLGIPMMAAVCVSGQLLFFNFAPFDLPDLILEEFGA